ncbi:LysR substrate-binding domain-containing protein [Streptomyces sp. RFCAC02]|uniref:LysR family transcriptional regulator n=1 Tax=Streptomyces sp. RFCAC02 TaxID=2499143 RepID=UPI00101FF6FB|nr:LysR substrate-binding domain-containing protein [Streptomyces sp. RFCAC02]
MDLPRHLRHFLAVADELHFGRAAELLGMAQPPLSQSVQRLERELGVALFDRGRRAIALTSAGRLLVPEARRLLAADARLRAVMAGAREGTHGTLRAGVPPEMPATALNEILRRLAATAPGLDLEFHELTSAEQLGALADGRIDTGLLQHPFPADGLVLGPPARTRLGVVLPRGGPLARPAAPPPALADLAGHDLVMAPRDAAPAWHDLVLATCRDHGWAPPRVRYARTPDVLLGLVLAGRGVAFTTEELARRQPRVAWRPLAGDPLTATWVPARPAGTPHPAAPRFAAVAGAVLGGAPEPAAGPAAAPGAPAPWSVVFDGG